MIWQSSYTLLINGNESGSPSGAGDQITLAIAGISPSVRLTGDVQQGGDGSLYGRVDKHVELRVVCKPFSVLSGVNVELQSYGTLWRLIYNVLPHTYIHIRGAYSTLDGGTGAGDSTIPRSQEATPGVTPGAEPTYDDGFWLSLLPMTCVLDGDATPATDFETGTENLSFTLVNRHPG